MSPLRRAAGRHQPLTWAPSGASEHDAYLHVRRLGENGPPVVLLHGLLASSRYWGRAFDVLAEDHRLVAPDLLGFGASPRPDHGYGPGEHADAVARCLRELGLDDAPALVVGHSMGSIVALHLAHRHPGLVERVVAFAPPIYDSRADAVRHIRALGFMTRLFAFDTRLARRACRWVCDHRELTGRLATRLRGDLPASIARDGVQHTWASYSQSVEEVILSPTPPSILEQPHCPVHIVAGHADTILDLPLLQRLEQRRRITLDIWADAEHDLILRQPGRCVEVLNGPRA